MNILLHYSVIICFIGLLISCKENKTTSNIPPTNKNEDVAKDQKPLFWEISCKNDNFVNLFDCNKSNCYQVELLSHLYKDIVILTLYINDSLVDKIYYNRFSVRSSRSNIFKKRKNDNNKFPIIYPINKDTFWYY
jgi:hypothetical protein